MYIISILEKYPILPNPIKTSSLLTQHSKQPTCRKSSKNKIRIQQNKKGHHTSYQPSKITIEVTKKKKNFIGWLQQVKVLEEMKDIQKGGGFLITTTIGECHSCNVQGIHGQSKHPPPPPMQRRRRAQREFFSPSPCLM